MQRQDTNKDSIEEQGADDHQSGIQVNKSEDANQKLQTEDAKYDRISESLKSYRYFLELIDNLKKEQRVETLNKHGAEEYAAEDYAGNVPRACKAGLWVKNSFQNFVDNGHKGRSNCLFRFSNECFKKRFQLEIFVQHFLEGQGVTLYNLHGFLANAVFFSERLDVFGIEVGREVENT